VGVRGHYTEPLTDELKDRFLDLIESGYTRPEAAEAVGSTARIMKSICNPESHRYDENFARTYHSLTRKGGQQEEMMAERLQDEAIRRGLRSSDRLLEKLLAIYHERWEIHRPQALRMDIQIDEIKMLFSGMSDETLQTVIRELESKKQLQAAPDDVIDADAA
jgi:hypothetical protein